MVKKCNKCGSQLPGLAQYCSNCGAKLSVSISYHEEDERNFAFHAEYYGRIERAGDVRSRGTEYTWYDGYLYELYKKNSLCYILKIKDDGSVLDIIKLGELKLDDYKICSNQNGLFLINNMSALLYDFEGNKKGEIIFKEKLGENIKVSNCYIFGSKIYVSAYQEIRMDEGVDSLAKFGVCVQRFDFYTDKVEIIWNLTEEESELEAFAKGQLDMQQEERLLWYCYDEPNVFVNSQYAVVYYNLLATPKGKEGYEIQMSPILLLDFETRCRKYIRISNRSLNSIRFDLCRNRMWIPSYSDNGPIFGKNDKLLAFPIQNCNEIDIEQKEDIWEFAHEFDLEQGYFDGEHAYCALNNYTFYAYKKDGSQAIEWNKSGHGNCQAFCVLGPYVYAVFDYDSGIYQHSIVVPKEKYFDWDSEIFEEMIYEKEKRKTDVLQEDVIALGDTFDAMSVLQFRAFFKSSSDYSEQFKTFRKNLKDDKWDFNVVMGILIGSNKRHATGPRHIQEQNAGIGQGDNKDMVVLTLNQYGMMDIYERYEKISNSDIKVVQVMKDICERNPKLTYICDEIRAIMY